ncbi:MAG: dihydrofolate reductase [Rikenellaceae bacterium]
MINVIVAIADNGVIGGDNQLLWHISEDLKHFKCITSGHPVIMGRKTYESLGRPLPNRQNIVISRSDLKIEGCTVVHSLNEALNLFTPADRVFIIGGAQIYAEAMPLADRLYLTRVHKEYEGDTIFPEWSVDEWQMVDQEHFDRGVKFEYPYTFEEYLRIKNSDKEYQITQVSPVEIPTLREIALPSFEQTYKGIVSKEQNDWMIDWMYSEESLKAQFEEGQQFYLFFEKGKAVGYLSLHPEAENLVHLEKLYFNYGVHGKGYGRVLIEHAFKEVKRLCKGQPCRMELNVNRSNKAVDFYFKIGLQIARQGDYKIEGTDFIRPDYILYKDL